MMAEFTIDDMINSAASGKPDAFRTAFDDIMLNKIADAIAGKREEIAQTMFADEEQADEQEEDLEQENDEVENGEETEEHSDEE